MDNDLAIIVIIIKTLFQEDNIFGTNASLKHGPQIQRHTLHAFDNYKTKKKKKRKKRNEN